MARTRYFLVVPPYMRKEGVVKSHPSIFGYILSLPLCYKPLLRVSLHGSLSHLHLYNQLLELCCANVIFRYASGPL